MKREIYNPFNEEISGHVSESSTNTIESTSFSVEDPNTCPKCSISLLEAYIGGQDNIDKTLVKYCSKCRVVIPVEA
jgi:hypothetical protein